TRRGGRVRSAAPSPALRRRTPCDRGRWPRTASTWTPLTRRSWRRPAAAAGVGVAHCPQSNGRLACGAAPLALLRAAGVRVGLGTDSPASAGRYDIRAEARACALVQAGAGRQPPGAEEQVRMATSGGSEVVGMVGM